MDEKQGRGGLRGARLALGVSPLASRAEVRRAFMARAQTAHPDQPGGCVERYRRLVEAFQALQAEASHSLAHERRLKFAAAWAA